ncbi:MAG: 8-amino-7-oxononanoate synthase [Pirellulaceae bacterium]|nr:8-amino-7-oxononanoate synthase [Pirellulaceae bacterium]
MTFDPLAWIDDELAALERQGLRRQLVARQTAQRPHVVIDGQALLNFSSNDYLGLAAEPLWKAVAIALPAHGWGSGASPLVTGRGQLHADLERELARFEGTEAALLFGSGYAANVGTVAALVGPGDCILSDERNHASLIDGCRLSGARTLVYRHADAGHAESLLRSAADCRRKLIVTDGLFSMDGDLAPLADLAELAERHAAMLLVDEAHATGVFGQQGRGASELSGVHSQVHIRVGTLSKALGSIGGFVAGRRSLIDWLANRARPYVFSTAPPEAACAAGLAALQCVRDEPQRRRNLLAAAAELRQRLSEQGWNTGHSASQIIPLIIGEPQPTMELAARLRARGLLVPGIRPPSVPPGQSLLRLSLTALHTPEMIDRLLAALADAGG